MYSVDSSAEKKWNHEILCCSNSFRCAFTQFKAADMIFINHGFEDDICGLYPVENQTGKIKQQEWFEKVKGLSTIQTSLYKIKSHWALTISV